MTVKAQVLETISDIMSFMAPSAGGAVPDANSDEFAQWLLAIQVKYEEASRRGFWRRLLKKETLTLTDGMTQVYLPVQFQRSNSLYIFSFGDIDYADPDREPDGQSIFVESETDEDAVDEDANEAFGRWKVTFAEALTENDTAEIWYFATPPVPEEANDKILLPGDMIAFGALSEVFRTTNLEGSQDDARNEYENRLATYMAMEAIPGRYEILRFTSNPSAVNRTARARAQYSSRDRRARSF